MAGRIFRGIFLYWPSGTSRRGSYVYPQSVREAGDLLLYVAGFVEDMLDVLRHVIWLFGLIGLRTCAGHGFQQLTQPVKREKVPLLYASQVLGYADIFLRLDVALRAGLGPCIRTC